MMSWVTTIYSTVVIQLLNSFISMWILESSFLDAQTIICKLYKIIYTSFNLGNLIWWLPKAKEVAIVPISTARKTSSNGLKK